MPAIYLKEPLSPEQVALLKEEFYPHELLVKCENSEDWQKVEIFYGNKLSETEIANLPNLRWIHSPSHDLSRLCLDEIEKKGTIALTLGAEINLSQIGEFAMGAILSFAKHFFYWPQAPHEPNEFWAWPLKETMWSLQGRVLLQVGLGEIGSEVVRLANAFGMRSWGMKDELSFHPLCKKTFSYANLHSVLPAADVVVIALPRGEVRKKLFKKEEFELMKEGSILIILETGGQLDEKDLAEVAINGKFRGVLIDTFNTPPPAKNSPLWKIPNGILTPSIAKYPQSEERMAFLNFRKNLRLFISDKIHEMKNLILFEAIKK